MTATRRQRRRVATTNEIKQAALDQLAATGPGGLSMRGIARTIGMSPAGLYRYFAGLDALITELLADTYNELADAVITRSSTGSGPDRLRAACLAYRTWSVDHPSRFLLLFGTPIPGYAAPEDGPTTEAARRLGNGFFSIIVDGWEAGTLAPPPGVASVEPGEQAFVDAAAPGLPPQVVRAFASAWAHLHGMVALEILHQLDWLYSDPARFFEVEVDLLVERWSL